MMTAYLVYLTPIVQVLALVAIGYVFRVDRLPVRRTQTGGKGGDSC